MNRSWKKLPELNRGETRDRPSTLEAANVHPGSSYGCRDMRSRQTGPKVFPTRSRNRVPRAARRLNDVRPCSARSAPDSSSIWDAKGNVRQPWREARAKQEEMCMQPGSSRRLRVFAATTLILGL